MNGTMPRMAEKISDNRLLSYVDSCLRGFGQICLMNNPLTGLLILMAIAIAEPQHGLSMLVAVVVATATAHLAGLDRGAIGAGLFGFNGALVGAGLHLFLDSGQYALLLTYVVVASAISVPVMAALIAWLGAPSKSAIPPLTLPFNIVTLMCLMGLQMVRYSAMPEGASGETEQPFGEVNAALRDEPGAEALDFSPLLVIQILLRGISQLFLVDNVIVGLVVLIAIMICSRISAAAAILGSAAGTLTAIAVGADGYSIYLGLFGFNGFITALAIAGVFVRFSIASMILGVLAGGLTSLFALGMQRSFDLVEMPFLTLPFVIVTTAILLFTTISDRFEVLPLTEVTTPEDHWRTPQRSAPPEVTT